MEERRDGPRLCYLVESFYPPDVGGLQRHAYQLMERLAAKGVEVFVVARRFEPTAATFECVGRLSVARIPPSGQFKGKGWKALGPLLVFVAGVLRVVMQEAHRYDILMVSGLKVLPFPAVLACALRRKKCVLKAESPAELWEEVSAESLRRMSMRRSSTWLKLLRRGRRRILRRADCVIAISSEIVRELRAIGVDSKKIRLIPNGIDTRRFRPASAAQRARLRSDLSLPADRIIVCFTGRLAASKGLMLLIEVWAELVQRHPEIHLLLVGSSEGTFDSCEDELRAYIQAHGLSPTVTLTGEVENVHQYLQAADLFVFPSAYEGFGIAMAEALACALPAVLTRVGFAAEDIQSGKNGLLVEPGDRRGLTEALEWLLEHPELWAALGESARRGIEERFSMEVVAESYRDLLVRLGEGVVPGAADGFGRAAVERAPGRRESVSAEWTGSGAGS